MPIPHSKLETLSTNHGRMVYDVRHKTRVFEVDSPHTFIQAIGYLKHLAGPRGSTVGYRGQRKLYDPSLVPSLFRGAASRRTMTKREEVLGRVLNRIKQEKEVLQAVNESAREPLLQHYGINTRWIDLVDNVWVALWFACHRAHSVPKAPRFVHFERRDPVRRDENRFAYVLVVEVERGVGVPACPGLYKGNTSWWIDLRIAVPSHFIRPHAQHGLLFRRNVYSAHDDADCAPFVVGIVRVRLREALDWIGHGSTLSVHSFFPPPSYDFGYQELLSKMLEVDDILGAIHHVGA